MKTSKWTIEKTHHIKTLLASKEARIDWNGESFDVNESYQMTKRELNKVLNLLTDLTPEQTQSLREHYEAN